jgi:hypothetical protein
VIGTCIKNDCNTTLTGSQTCPSQCVRLGNQCYLRCPDNYVNNAQSVCVAKSCNSRLPLGDYKTCSLSDDANTCYYKQPQTQCLIETCPQVFRFSFCYMHIYVYIGVLRPMPSQLCTLCISIHRFYLCSRYLRKSNGSC